MLARGGETNQLDIEGARLQVDIECASCYINSDIMSLAMSWQYTVQGTIPTAVATCG